MRWRWDARANPSQSMTCDRGDLVFYNTLGREFSHVGIYIGDQRFIHAPSSGGTVEIVSMGNRYWARRYSGARRIVA